jgi:hypothetical protein
MDPRYRVARRSARVWTGPARAGLLLTAALALCACEQDSAPPLAFPSEPTGRLEIEYPLDETLFPPEIVAPTFVWKDETEGVAQWEVLLRFDPTDEVRRFPTAEPRWRPSEADWAEIKRRSVERDAEVAIVGVGPRAEAASSASVRIRTSTDPVGDSIFYREVPLPFIKAVQDPSRIRWRFGSIDSEARPPIVLEDLPVCGNCHSFSGDGSKLGLDVDYGNDKGGYAILPVSQQMVMNDEKIITWSDYERDDGEATFGLLSQVSPDGRRPGSSSLSSSSRSRASSSSTTRRPAATSRCRAPTTPSTSRATRPGAPTESRSSSPGPRSTARTRSRTPRASC